MGLLDQTCGGMVVYPTFSRRGNSQDESPTKEASAAPANPRQHFFELAGQQMVQDESEFSEPSTLKTIPFCTVGRNLSQGFPQEFLSKVAGARTHCPCMACMTVQKPVHHTYAMSLSIGIVPGVNACISCRT